MAARNDGGLYAKVRSLFISKATMDDFIGWATPGRRRPCPGCSARNWPTGNVRSANGFCAAPGSPSSKAWTGTRSTGCWT